MAIDNFALYMWYLIPAVAGALYYTNKKKDWRKGALIGLGIAFVAITLFALSMGP